MISVKNISFNHRFCIDYIRVPQIFQKSGIHLKTFRHQNGDMNQVPYWGPTNFKPHP